MVRFGGYMAGIKRDERTRVVRTRYFVLGTWRNGGQETGYAIILAWKSWKRGPEGQPLLATLRFQTIAIYLVATSEFMQRVSASNDDSSNVSSKSYKQTSKITVLYNLVLYNVIFYTNDFP